MEKNFSLVDGNLEKSYLIPEIPEDCWLGAKIHHPAGDVLAFTIGNTERLRVNSSGITVTGIVTANTFDGATSSWVVGSSGASNYLFTGPGGLSNSSNSTLYLARGQTYIFDMNASGHGFGIQTVSGSWSSGNEYTTGTTNPRADTTPITFAVPFSAPNTLYYACTAGHSGMVGSLVIYPTV